MEITKERLQAEYADLASRRNGAMEMVLRYDGAMQAVESLIALCEQEPDPE